MTSRKTPNVFPLGDKLTSQATTINPTHLDAVHALLEIRLIKQHLAHSNLAHSNEIRQHHVIDGFGGVRHEHATLETGLQTSCPHALMILFGLKFSFADDYDNSSPKNHTTYNSEWPHVAFQTNPLFDI